MDEQQYAKQFNDGYFMAKLEPELFKMLEPSLDKDNPMLHGKQEFEIEKAQDYFKKFDKGQDNGKDRTKDKDVKR